MLGCCLKSALSLARLPVHVTRSPIFKLGKTTASPVFKTKRTTGSASVHFLVHYLSPLAALLPDADDAAW